MSADGADMGGRQAEASMLALEVLDNVRSTLMMSYRYLDRALFKMPHRENGVLDLMGTDGKELQFNAGRVLKRYEASADELVRDYLHLVMHCVFYHPFVGSDANPLAWDLACDIVTESACLGVAGRRFKSGYDGRRARVIQMFEDKLGNLSAEKLYRHIVQTGIEPKEADFLKALFIRDDHGLWYRDRNPEETQGDAETASGLQESNSSTGGDKEQREEDRPDEEGDVPGDAGGGGQEHAGGEDAPPREAAAEPPEPPENLEGEIDPVQAAPAAQVDEAAEFEAPGDQDPQDGPDGSAKEEWESISQQVKVDLETRSGLYGSDAGGMVQALRIANRRKQDYRSFLRRFAELDEEMAVNDDEFDLVYYSYGLRTYGNMPLIEPLEYREAKKVREFVIAIDTSGSVEGDLVRRFVEETYNLFKSTESFFSQVNIRIMQCDARVQSDVEVKSLEDFERYMKAFELKGFGGTDFRPVFARVDEHVRSGGFENLRGLIYFTDGYGTYPTEPPAYETVFVFSDIGYSGADVPPWAMRLYLDTAQLEGTDA